ncbi:MAG: hypothetical protein JSS12_11760, partial [Verrucomicrobia bacterium]|nr:hypothetical protein [Verrucomicrobiota bacterium]
MTFVGADRVDFFEAFDSKHSWAHDANLEECELVSSQGALAIQAKSSTIGRWISFGISFDAVKNVRQIVELAKATLNAHDSNSPEERILSKYRAASRTCLLIARKEKCEELYELGKRFLNLEAEKRKQDPLYVACQNRTFHVALDLLKAEPQKIGIAFGSYTDLLRLAFEQKEYRLCRQFIHLGADPNAAFGLNVANVASLLLVDAIKEGQEKVAIILVEVGADLTVHKEGKSPLHYAAGQGFCRLADTMIQRGADVLEVDDSVNSPLHEAARGYHADMVRLLIQHGSNIAELNRDKQCALMLPESFGDKERAADFYLRVLSQYQISRDLLLEQGIHGFLAECQEVPAKLIHGLSGPNPFELALFFQDSTLAKNIARDMPL